MIQSSFYLLKSNVAGCRNADNNQNRSWSPIFSQGGQRPSNRPHFLQTAICEAQRRVSSHHVPTFKNWFKMQSAPLWYGGRCPPIKVCPNAPDFALYEFGMVTSTVPVFTVVCTALVPSVTEPVYDFEMVTKSQFHPRWATVMVLSGDCSSPKTEQKLGQTFIGVLIQTFITHLIASSSKVCSLQGQGNANDSCN